MLRAVEGAVIPRLLLARTPAGVWAAAFRADEVDAFADMLLDDDGAAAHAYVSAARARGVAVEAIYVSLLAEAAKCLGARWEDDRVDFARMTVGLGRLQTTMRELGPAFRAERAGPTGGRRILLIPVPGEQHTFGLAMVADFFRRAGWVVAASLRVTPAEAVGLVRREAFAVIGISLASETRLDPLATLIHAIRRGSRNKAIGVMVGGPVFIARPELAPLVGADATARDGQHAVVQAQSLLSLLAEHA